MGWVEVAFLSLVACTFSLTVWECNPVGIKELGTDGAVPSKCPVGIEGVGTDRDV